MALPRTTASRLQALRALFVLALGVGLWWGCEDHGPAAPQRVLPAVLSSSVSPNVHNTISAVVAARTSSAERVRVELDVNGIPAASTPDLSVRSETTSIPVLGLLPETEYGLRTVATSITGDTAVGERMTFRSGRLPESLAAFEAVAFGTPEPGYTMLAPIRLGPPHPVVIVDAAGRVVWYRETPTPVGDFQLQPNGHYTAAVQTTFELPYAAAAYEEWDPLGNVVGTWTVSGHEFTDLHEIRLLGHGEEAVLMGFEARTLDVSALGGSASATVIGNVFQRVSRGGAVTFQWNAFDHYAPSDADDYVWSTPGPAGYDFTHGNAIEVDRDGNYLLSMRSLSEITKIDRETGAVLWRMGKGNGNQFTFLNDPHDGFTSMHAVRRLENGHLLLIDNGNLHSPPSSRAVEYAVDEGARTATLVWSFEPGVFSCCMGNAQRLPGGNTLVTLGQDDRLFEVSPAGQIVWELRLPAGGTGFFGIYRAFRISSLYSTD